MSKISLKIVFTDFLLFESVIMLSEHMYMLIKLADIFSDKVDVYYVFDSV